MREVYTKENDDKPWSSSFNSNTMLSAEVAIEHLYREKFKIQIHEIIPVYVVNFETRLHVQSSRKYEVTKAYAIWKVILILDRIASEARIKWSTKIERRESTK